MRGRERARKKERERERERERHEKGEVSDLVLELVGVEAVAALQRARENESEWNP